MLVLVQSEPPASAVRRQVAGLMLLSREFEALVRVLRHPLLI